MVRKGDAGKPLALSQEYVIDSDSNGLAEADSSPSETPSISKRSTHGKTKQKDDTAATAATAEQVSPAKSPGSEHSASGEGEAIPTSSPSSEESAVESVPGHRGNAEAIEKKNTASTSHSAPITIAARPFQPLEGFREVRPDRADLTAAALGSFPRDFSAKQIWHITAPSSVPIASIKQLNFDAVRSGESILTHNHQLYAFSSGPDNPKDLLLRQGTNNVYKRARTSVSKSYHLQHVHNHSQVEETTKNGQPTREPHYFARRQPSPKAAPKQPGLLRMRYKPFGTKDGPTASAGINEDPAPAEIEHQTPPPSSTPSHRSTAKKKKSKRLNPSEQGGLADKITEIDESRSRATKMRPSSSPATPSAVKMLINTDRGDNNAGEASVERKKKKKRKKFGDEPA